MLDAHLSMASGVFNALIKAEAMGLQTVQIFAKNQQQWASRPLGPVGIARWKAECKRLGFTRSPWGSGPRSPA